jgi:hypothetical protein
MVSLSIATPSMAATKSPGSIVCPSLLWHFALGPPGKTILMSTPSRTRPTVDLPDPARQERKAQQACTCLRRSVQAQGGTRVMLRYRGRGRGENRAGSVWLCA